MITKLYLENFRGFPSCEIDLGKINIFTGANNSGKSSIIYGLLALKNVVLNSNQNLDSFLNLGFLSLGGFTQAVYLKDDTKKMILGIDAESKGVSSRYIAALGKQKSTLSIKVQEPYKANLELEVNFPYAANTTTGCDVKTDFGTVKVTWNGITATINIESKETIDPIKQNEIITSINNSFSKPIDDLRSIDFIPLRRGFTKPNYSSVPLQQQLLTEEELATLLATDRDLEGKVAFYLEKILEKSFSVRATIGTANFNLQSRDRSTGFVCDLVNEGFGTNQLVSILTKSLRKEMKTICVEESEIHIHPELMNKFIQALIEITNEEDKRFLITTHSEHIVSSLLNSVSKKALKPEDLRIFYLYKDKKKSIIEKQIINAKGQVEGGLKSFYETELKETKDFFNVSRE